MTHFINHLITNAIFGVLTKTFSAIRSILSDILSDKISNPMLGLKGRPILCCQLPDHIGDYHWLVLGFGLFIFGCFACMLIYCMSEIVTRHFLAPIFQCCSFLQFIILFFLLALWLQENYIGSLTLSIITCKIRFCFSHDVGGKISVKACKVLIG